MLSGNRLRTIDVLLRRIELLLLLIGRHWRLVGEHHQALHHLSQRVQLRAAAETEMALDYLVGSP